MEAIMKTCTMDGCDNPYLAKGLCRKHYLRKRRTGRPEGVRPNGTLNERFWPKVDKRGAKDCWEWQASKTPRGYGQIGPGGNAKPIPAHRASFMLAFILQCSMLASIIKKQPKNAMQEMRSA